MSLSQARSRPLAILDSGIWYLYLLTLVCVSFINETFPSASWLIVTAVVYSLLCLAALSAGFGGRCNWAALQAARYPLLFLSLTLFYLGLQQVLPYQTEAHRVLLSGADQPPWFQAETVWSVVPSKTRLLLLSELLMFGAMLLSLALFSSRRKVLQFLYVIMAVCFLHGVVGVFTKFGGISLVDLKSVDGHFSAARAWFVNRNHFAAFISISLVGAVALQLKLLIRNSNRPAQAMLSEQLLSYRVLYLLFILIAILALVLSESRAGFLAIFISSALVFWKFGSTVIARGKKRIIVVPLLLISALMMIYFGGELVQRFASDQLFLGERSLQWSISWGAIQAEWLLGYGANSYADIFQMQRGYSELRGVLFDQAHNDYLHIWLEQGLIGLLLWLAFLVLSLRVALQGTARTSSSLVNAVVLAGLAVIIAALIQSLVDFNLHITNIRYYFFVIMALVIATPTIRHRKGGTESSVLV